MTDTKQAAVDDALRDLYRLVAEREAGGADPGAFAVAALNIASAILTKSLSADEVKTIAAGIVDHWTDVRAAKRHVAGDQLTVN